MKSSPRRTRPALRGEGVVTREERRLYGRFAAANETRTTKEGEIMEGRASLIAGHIDIQRAAVYPGTKVPWASKKGR